MSFIISFIKKYKLKIILIITIIVICSLGTYFSNFSYRQKIPKINIDEKYRVIKVLDGDTFEIKVKNQTVTVRMLGIDTPETVDPRKLVQCFGNEASDKTKELLLKYSVKLQIDFIQSITDKYGRLLAYVYREDGLFINKYLLENGYAHEYTYDTPYEKKVEFKELEKKAKEEKQGLWGSLCFQK